MHRILSVGFHFSKKKKQPKNAMQLSAPSHRAYAKRQKTSVWLTDDELWGFLDDVPLGVL